MNNKTILFHSNQLASRGTEVALYDYAHYNEVLLKNKSIIISPKHGNHSTSAIEKFSKRFGNIIFYENGFLQEEAQKTSAEVFYAIKPGEKDGIMVEGMKNCMHVVFKNNDPHGDVYAYVSEWLAIEASNGKHPYVPHMINLPKTDKNLREKLGIPQNATIVGRHGGETTFDIKFAQKAVENAASKRNDLYFLFLGTKQFGGNWFRKRSERIIFLPETTNLEGKSIFINTCDAMLHARAQGESFGLSVGEFSIFNKPVISYSGSNEKAHIFELKEKGIYYSSQKELEKILLGFEPQPSKNWDAYSEKFSPESVMKKFNEVFLLGV